MKTINKLILTSLIMSSVAYSQPSENELSEAVMQLKQNIQQQQVKDAENNLATIKRLSDGYLFIVTSDDNLWSNNILLDQLDEAQIQYTNALVEIVQAYRSSNPNESRIDNTLKPTLTKAKQIKDAIEETSQAMVLKGASKKAKEKLQQR